jgi:ATP-dependent Clp protease protease subunit
MLPEIPPYARTAPARLDDEEEDEKSAGTRLPVLRRLLDSRTILLCGPVTDDLAREVMAQLLVLDATPDPRPIRVFVNSPGGSVDAGFAIYDAMRFVKSPVISICAGLAASAATVILLGAAKGRRYSLPNTRYLIHQPSTGMQGTASDVAIGAKEILKLREKVNRLLADETGQSYDRVCEDTHRDYWMSAEEAKSYGLIQHIVGTSSELPAK